MFRARHRLESALHCYKESARTEESVLVRKDSITWHRLSDQVAPALPSEASGLTGTGRCKGAVGLWKGAVDLGEVRAGG